VARKATRYGAEGILTWLIRGRIYRQEMYSALGEFLDKEDIM